MPLVGTIRVPSDKSISHRAVLLAGLAQGTSHLSQVLDSKDIDATIAFIRALGARIEVRSEDAGSMMIVEGIGLMPKSSEPLLIDCGNSGTTARLAMGALAGLGIEATIVGDASLSKRPMARVTLPLQEAGAVFEGGAQDTLPVHMLSNDGLIPVDLLIEQASAQVKSAILLAGMQTDGTTRVTEPLQSRDHTERLLGQFGVPVERDGLMVRVTGPVCPRACDMSVPADISLASYLVAAAALVPGSDLRLTQVCLNPTRMGAIDALMAMGADIDFENTELLGNEPVADIHVRYSSQLDAVRVSAADVVRLIDEVPILAVAAACAQGESVFESVGELRVKESDRLAATIEGLAAFGVEASLEGDDLHVHGIGSLAYEQGFELPVGGDHRMAMTWYLAGLAGGCETAFADRDCVAVSWPDFFEDVAGLLA